MELAALVEWPRAGGGERGAVGRTTRFGTNTCRATSASAAASDTAPWRLIDPPNLTEGGVYSHAWSTQH